MASPDLLTAVRESLPFSDQVTGVEPVPVSERVTRLLLSLADGTQFPCVVKTASTRELLLYEQILTPEETGAPQFIGGYRWPDEETCYLFLECLPEQFLDPESSTDVVSAYRFLGELHRYWAARPQPDLPAGSPWEITPADIESALESFPRLASHAAEVAEAFGKGPRTLIHGDYYRWNVLVDDELVRVLDWEHATFSHPLWDVVLLTPDRSHRESQLGGAMAELALRVYHGHGPFADMPFPEFDKLHRMARIALSARRALAHKARMAESPHGPAEVIRVHLRHEQELMEAMGKRLQWW